MSNLPALAEIAALVGDPARANMLAALMDRHALSAGELAYAGHISPATASAHLAKLVAAGLLAPARHGRHRYFRLASPRVAQMLEGIMAAAAEVAPRRRPWPAREEGLRTARTCYDHLAGRLGVALADSLAARGHIALDADGGEVTAEGAWFLAGFGLDLAAACGGRRPFCRPCLDWSERRLHLAGALGAALARHCFVLGWVERRDGTRALAITSAGETGFAETFGVTFPES